MDVAANNVGAAVQHPFFVDGGKVLRQRAAEHDVQQLAAAAYSEQRLVALERRAAERRLEAVALNVGRAAAAAFLAVERGRYVLPASEYEAVELRCELFYFAFVLRRR